MVNIKFYTAICLIILYICIAGCSSEKDSENKPNILVLISDDQRWDQVSYPGNQIIAEFETPNLDKLASNGAYFTNAFVTTPICAVSRACIMTGRYESSHGMNHFNTPLEDDVIMNTYPALLKNAGYFTGILGKWGMGMAGTEEIFDVCNAWYNQGSYFHIFIILKMVKFTILNGWPKEQMNSLNHLPQISLFALQFVIKLPIIHTSRITEIAACIKIFQYP